MWSGFFAGILAAVAAVVSVILGWFFNQSGKVSAVRKALQLEIDANWQRLEDIRKTARPGKRVEDLDTARDRSALEKALKRNPAMISGWQRSVWNNNLVEIVATLHAEDVAQLQDFYMSLERLEHLAGHEQFAEAGNALFELLGRNKPQIRAAQWYDSILNFIGMK